jgi:hypothetical protein
MGATPIGASNFIMQTPDIAFGIEIETPWATMLARVDNEAAELLRSNGSYYNMDETAQKRMQIGFDRLDNEYGKRIEGVFNEDIRRGRDSYAEFALQPKRDIGQLIATVQHLYDVDILRAGEIYPMQFTLGNVPGGQLASYVLMATELCGGTTPERMAEINTWSRKGIAGLHVRKPSELQLGMTVGVELRTLVLNGMERFRRALETAELAGRMVLRSLSGDRTAAEGVHEMRNILKDMAAEKSIDTTVKWWNPQGQPHPWVEYAAALTDNTWHEGTQAKLESVLR